MSYNTWTDYGYGVCTSELKKELEVNKIIELVKLAPRLYSDMQDDIKTNGMYEESYEILTDFVDNYSDVGYGGLATILQAVIKEQEGIELYVCDDFDGKNYLIYPPIYPWQMYTQKESLLTEKGIAEMIGKYLHIVTDEDLTVGYQSVSNGG